MRGKRVRMMPTVWLLGMIVFFALTFLTIPTLPAQTFTIIHDFGDGTDGSQPRAGLTMDRAGNLYGTAQEGGAEKNACNFYYGCGTAFKLMPEGSGWIFTPLYHFAGRPDGALPNSRLTMGPDGALYGTTEAGGIQGSGLDCFYGCGTVFKLQPAVTACKAASCPWTETVIYRFAGYPDGANPGGGDLILDQDGNLYGTTTNGGSDGEGTVYKLTPSDGGWTETIVYNFTGVNDGGRPYSGVVFDQSGDLYGTASQFGSYGWGTVVQFTPSGLGWTHNVLHAFQSGNDGAIPYGDLLFDKAGNLYGTTTSGYGDSIAGTVFELTPASGSWTYNVLYHFVGTSDYCGPYGGLTMDAQGNLYGTTLCAGYYYGFGAVFELTRSTSGWIYTALYNFRPNYGIGSYGKVIFDASGNLYGTAYGGGVRDNGVIWEITP